MENPTTKPPAIPTPMVEIMADKMMDRDGGTMPHDDYLHTARLALEVMRDEMVESTRMAFTDTMASSISTLSFRDSELSPGDIPPMRFPAAGNLHIDGVRLTGPKESELWIKGQPMEAPPTDNDWLQTEPITGALHPNLHRGRKSPVGAFERSQPAASSRTPSEPLTDVDSTPLPSATDATPNPQPTSTSYTEAPADTLRRKIRNSWCLLVDDVMFGLQNTRSRRSRKAGRSGRIKTSRTEPSTISGPIAFDALTRRLTLSKTIPPAPGQPFAVYGADNCQIVHPDGHLIDGRYYPPSVYGGTDAVEFDLDDLDGLDWDNVVIQLPRR